jgi:hypothetical protein
MHFDDIAVRPGSRTWAALPQDFRCKLQNFLKTSWDFIPPVQGPAARSISGSLLFPFHKVLTFEIEGKLKGKTKRN